LRASLCVGTAQFGGGVTGVAQFSNSTGQVESTPHNVIHDAVGGNGGLMADPDAAAADPIFWIHHANIDRLWFIWNTARHRNTNDRRWTRQTFSFFDANGHRVSKTPADVLDIVGQPATRTRLCRLGPRLRPPPPGGGRLGRGAATLS
jgi:tyrosinase